LSRVTFFNGRALTIRMAGVREAGGATTLGPCAWIRTVQVHSAERRGPEGVSRPFILAPPDGGC
jgi:hypothetical protein